MIKSRRNFVITSAGIASGLALSRVAFADAAKVSETPVLPGFTLRNTLVLSL